MSAHQQACDEEPRAAAGKGKCLHKKNLLLCVLVVSTVFSLALLITYVILTCCLESCDNEECLVAKLLDTRNDTIDPCKDFYGYTCGNWEDKIPSRMTKKSLNVFDILLEENQLILRKLLEAPKPGAKGSAKEKAHQFYKSCMDTQQIEAQGAEPLKDIINEIGGWNFTRPEEEIDFNQTLRTLMGNYSTFPFFKAFVGPSLSDPSISIIQIDHPAIEMPAESDYKKKSDYPKDVRLYLSYLLNLGRLLGVPEDITATYISFTLAFISNLQRVVTPLQKRQERRMLFYKTTIEELQEKAPAIDWLSCLEAAFYPVQLNLSQPIVVHDMDYLKNMSRLITQWQDRSTLHIYMILHMVVNLSPALDSRFQHARQELMKKLLGPRKELGMVQDSRWQKCLSETSIFFEPVLGEMMVQEIFPPEAKELAEKIFSEVQNALLSRLDHVGWMDEQTRQEAKSKVSKVRVEIGYPDYILQTAEVDKEYKNLKINEDTFFLNVVASLKAQRESFSQKLLYPLSQDSWQVVPWSVRSYYSLRNHAVVFPAGMFRSPFFHTRFPSAVNFGAMGVFMAHELLHTFYDYVLPDSCSRCNRRVLEQEIDCLVKQYESYSLQGLRVNGTFTLLENAADTGGLTIAYQAYKNWLKNHKKKRNFHYTGLSHHQLFYLSFARAMCGYQSPENLQDFLNRDQHSPLPLRVRGTLSNAQDFARHFHCPSRSQMNPASKCHLW